MAQMASFFIVNYRYQESCDNFDTNLDFIRDLMPRKCHRKMEQGLHDVARMPGGNSNLS
jgi:hypothetical protein